MVWARTNRPLWLRCATGILIPAIAAFIRIQFLDVLELRAAFLTFYPAVAVAALYGGFSAGLLATIVSAILADYFWIVPAGHLAISSIADQISIIVFFGSGALVSYLAEATYRAQARTLAAEEGLRLVAEREKAALELHQTESKYRELVQNANSAILRWKHDGTITFFNEYAQEFFGYGEEELIGKNVALLFPEQESGDVGELFQAFVTQPEKYANNVNENILKDGTRVWMAWTNSPVLNEGGEVLEILAVGSDITERKHTEDALKESEEKHRLLAENVSDVIWILDLERGRFRYISPSVERLRGYTAEEVMAQDMSMAIMPDSLRYLQGVLPERIEKFHRGLVEFYVDDMEQPHKNGTIIKTEVTSRYIMNKATGHLEVIGVTRDITDRKRVEEALRASEERLRLALGAAKAGTWEWDLKDNRNLWSDELWRLYGMEPHSCNPTYETWLETIHPEDRERTGQLVREASRNGTELHAEWRLHHQNGGGEHWLMSRGQPLHDAQGKPVRYIGVAIDITERKRAEKGLRRFELLAAHSRDIILFMRRDDGRILEANDAAINAYGYSHQELMTMNIYNLRMPDEPGLTAEQLKQADTHGILFENIHRRKDGSSFPAEVSSRGATIEGTRTLISIIRDMTERSRSELVLRNSLEEKVALLKEVHHRVKNNLQVVVSLLGLQANSTENQDALEILKDTRNRVRSMALLHEVLYHSENLARIHFHTYIGDLCRQIVSSFGKSAQRVNVEIRVDEIGLPMDQAVPCGLIINEIVTNAFKYAFPDERSGSITVELDRIPGQMLFLKIRDNGVGLPPGLDPGHTSTLGLQLVHDLTFQLGGHAVVQSSPESGTRFEIVFPHLENTSRGGIS